MITSALTIRNLNAFVGDKQILHNVTCTFEKGRIAVLMGPNGSGKSTLAHVIMGDPRYSYYQIPLKGKLPEHKKYEQEKVHTNNVSQIFLKGKNILKLPTEEKARMGLFLSFQSPIAIPGVSVKELLKASYHNNEKSIKESLSHFNNRILSVSTKLHIDRNLLTRGIHEEFSGGERKKIELLQALLLRPSFAIFDEIDTGVDVDALQLIAKGIVELKKDNVGIILITHNERILRYVDVDTVMVLVKGSIVRTGTSSLIKRINTLGYKNL